MDPVQQGKYAPTLQKGVKWVNTVHSMFLRNI